MWPLWLAFLLLLIALGAGAWYAWNHLQTLRGEIDQSVESQLSKVESTTQQVRSDQSAFTSSMSTLQQQLQAYDTRIDELSAQLDKTAQQLLADQATSRTDWLLAEAEYLLRLANQRVLLEKDVDSALAILIAADEALKETDEVAVIPIRKTIASEMLALKSLGEVDVTGAYLKLEALAEQITRMDESLMLKESPLAKQTMESGDGLVINPDAEQTDTSAAEEADQPWYRKALTTAQETLNRFVIVRDLDEPIAPLLAPEQTHYLRQNLRLMIEQAELALLEQNQEIYSNSLDKAEKWIRSYFVEDSSQTNALLDSIESLKAISVDPELPDISASLRQLKGLLESVYQIGPSSNPPSDESGE
ncbi:uroporphyrinogen-III C-methyltransferase [Allohahella marinimesophila]|uniref:Uroporphyrinogen-III C-methyltransferase n=1 Tax=Allohahella marinimesophila TaxID=1054972 RepID=A0ABP7P7A4_9GAMM